MNEIKEYTNKIIEDTKHIDENNNEYWLSRELMPLLEYTLWQRFSNTIKKAIENLFRIAQTDAKLKRDNVDNEYTANSVHFEVVGSKR